MLQTAYRIAIGLSLSVLIFTGAACDRKPPKSGLDKALEIAAKNKTHGNYLDVSLAYYQAGQYEKSIEAAQESLKLKADYAPAYSNICAAYNQLKMWDKGIEACAQALKIDPNFQLAKNNMGWALAGKQGKK